MKWLTLWIKLGKQPIKITQNNDVYALLKNPKTNRYEHVPLCLKFDSHNKPYFVQEKNKEKKSWQSHKK